MPPSADGASTAGRVFGWMLVAAGALLFFGGALLSGIWLALIGFFLIAAASAEGRQAEVRGALSGVSVRAAMSADPVTAPADTTVTEFLNGPLFRYRHSAFPVTHDDGVPIGMVSIHQVREVPVHDRETTTLAQVMRPREEIATAGPDEPLTELLARTDANPEHRALVMEGERVVGIVTPTDINRILSWLSSGPPTDVPRQVDRPMKP